MDYAQYIVIILCRLAPLKQYTISQETDQQIIDRARRIDRTGQQQLVLPLRHAKSDSASWASRTSLATTLNMMRAKPRQKLLVAVQIQLAEVIARDIKSATHTCAISDPIPTFVSVWPPKLSIHPDWKNPHDAAGRLCETTVEQYWNCSVMMFRNRITNLLGALSRSVALRTFSVAQVARFDAHLLGIGSKAYASQYALQLERLHAPTAKEVCDGKFECPQCKAEKRVANNTQSTQVQTRSGDESMTSFVLCNECGNRFRRS